MNQFNIRRFGQLFKLDLMENKKHYLYLVIGVFLAHLMAQVLCNSDDFFGRPTLNTPEDFTANAAMSAIIVSAIILIADIGYTFDFLKTKEKRISYLMLPASNAEKFLERLLVNTVGIFLLNIVLLYLADVTRMGISRIVYGGQTGLQFGPAISFFCDGFAEGWQYVSKSGNGQLLVVELISSCLGGVLTAVCYVLGSVVIRRNAFIFTSLILLAFSVIFGAIVVSWTRHYVEVRTIGHNMVIPESLVYLKCVVYLLLIGFGLWGSYRLFCRIPVTRRSFFK